MVMASTLHATSPRSGLGEPTHEFLEILAALTPRYKQEKSRVGNQCFLQCMCSQPVLRKLGELLSPVVQNPLRLFAYFFCKFLLIDYPINTAFPVGGKVESWNTGTGLSWHIPGNKKLLSPISLLVISPSLPWSSTVCILHSSVLLSTSFLVTEFFSLAATFTVAWLTLVFWGVLPSLKPPVKRIL